MESPPWSLVDCPPDARRVVRNRKVRLGDVGSSGYLRLDALARYLQDVAADDVDEAGIEGAWVLRRTAVVVKASPKFSDEVEMATFCSGTGSRVAERRTTLSVAGIPFIEAVGLWVFIDRDGRPAELENRFFDVYGVSAQERKVRGRLRLPRPSSELVARPWITRASDFDVLGHMNNALAWVMIKDAQHRMVPKAQIASALLEYRVPIDPTTEIGVVSELNDDHLAVWITGGSETFVAARLDLNSPAQG